MEKSYAIITPCFNENETIIKFLEKLERTLQNLPSHFVVVVVDDCSTDSTLSLLMNHKFTAPNIELDIITLIANRGHQGAIYQGLLYAKDLDTEKFIVMDSDGEDDPDAIIDLLLEDQADVVHVVRGERNERWQFKFLYIVYKWLFFFITHRQMNFGNYSMINRRVLNAVESDSFIHFAAYLSKVRGEHAYITYDRLERLGGNSKMKTSGLIYHAFKSLTEYAEDLLLLFLKLFLALIFCIGILIFYILYEKIFTDDAILGWASTMIVGLLNMALLSLGFYVIGILLLNITHFRNASSRGRLYKKIDLGDSEVNQNTIYRRK